VSARVWLIYGWGGPDTVAAYLETWTSRHPRPERTSAKYEQRISRVLDVKVGMRIVEIWDSREQHDRWMQETIQPAIQAVAGEHGRAAPPPRFTEFAVHRHESR
jgi:hypothetical protein